MAISLASCGGKKNSDENEKIVLTPETTNIKGDLGDYFKVVDKEYTVTNDFGDMVTIEVERTDKEYSFDLKGAEPYGTFGRDVTGHAGFGIEILDEDGNVIEKIAATASGLIGMYSSDDMKEALKLKAGEKGTVRWSFQFDSDKKPAKFRLTSSYEEEDSSNLDSDSSTSVDDDSSSSDADDSSISSSSSSSEDWDELLESYEEYVDKYISYLKKASKGDMTALSEYPSMMEKAQEFSKKMKNARSDMSAAQWAKYNKITMKMLEAAQQMKE